MGVVRVKSRDGKRRISVHSGPNEERKDFLDRVAFAREQIERYEATRSAPRKIRGRGNK